MDGLGFKRIISFNSSDAIRMSLGARHTHTTQVTSGVEDSISKL